MAKTVIIPRKDADLISVIKNVSDAWQRDSDLKLKWITAMAFRSMVVEFETSFKEKNDASGQRSIVSNSLAKIRKDVREGEAHVKVYLKAIYFNDAPAHYASFGIVKSKSSYALPADFDKLSPALELMLSGLVKNDLNDKPYGTAFWTDVKSRLNAAMAQSRNLDSTVKDKVINKDELRANIRKTLNALIALLKANYPDAYKEKLRVWGFQKEKY